MTRKAQRLKRQRESDELPASTDGNGATAAAPQPPPAKKSKTSQKPARKRAHEKAAARGRPNARFSRSNALRRLKKQPAKPPARGRVYFVDVRETNGVQHYIYRSDVGFEELVGWRNRKGHVVKGYVEPDGPAKVVVGRLCDRTLPVGTPCFRDTGIPMSTDSLPGFEPWLLEDGTHLFPSHPGAITELRSFDDKTVFLVMDAGSVTPAEGCPEIPVDKFLDIVHRETFPEEYKRLDSLGHRLLRQTREALLGAIKPSYDAAKEIAHRAVQSLLVIKPWHLGTWMKYAKYAFTSADAESPGQVLWGGMDLGAEQISARMRTITRFANAYGSMRSVCAGVKRMPDIKRHGPERVKLALTFINERRPLDKPAVTEDDLFGTLEWRAREARRIVAEWHGPLPEESDTLVDAFLEHAGIGAAPGHPTTNLTASRLRLALKRGLQRHKERLKPSSDIHSTTAINSFQVDGNSIKYHFDWQDFEVEINCVVPHGRYELGHLDMPEYKVAAEVRPGQVFFFHGRKTLHGTYKGAVRGVRNSINAFTVQNVAKASFDGKVDGRSRETLQKRAREAMTNSLISIKRALIRQAIKSAAPHHNFPGDSPTRKTQPLQDDGVLEWELEEQDGDRNEVEGEDAGEDAEPELADDGDEDGDEDEDEDHDEDHDGDDDPNYED